MTRQRTCTSPRPAHGGASCVGTTIETKSCRTYHHCPIVDGGWSNWNLWSPCSGTCGRGTMTRQRTCTNPSPAHGGASCVGTSTETQSCTTYHRCPTSGGWSQWSPFSHCSNTCGDGRKYRTRTCSNPRPVNGGADCVGLSSESIACRHRRQCPVDGQWSSWSPYSTCSTTCGYGTTIRYRSCSNPAPLHRGKSCYGSNSEKKPCYIAPCPVDGQWSTWSLFSQCSTTCGKGTQQRHRTCSNPAPSNGGKTCIGDDKESAVCEIQQCSVDGQWSPWSLFSQCSTTCGKGTQQRHRTCSNPAPSNGGKTCVGDDKESAVCEIQHCPVDGQWSKWSLFSQCSTTCGKGTQQRHRACSNPAPSNGGKTCVGDDKESAVCEIQQCPVTTTPSRGIHLVTIRK
ncbi:coadhesin-like isoform X1 [Saccostrea cucullata]|uniref:coadhesin-like isoform X1 n=1 Tax=Saccostrea cuccullata TaxID=36930 RepID=UPI002ED16735